MIPATVTIHATTWDVLVATTPAELSQGLSNQISLDPHHGILFDLGAERIVTINMQEMLFPLDIIFIGQDLIVTEVALGVLPLNDIITTKPCRFFLEVNNFEADEVIAGDAVAINGYTPPQQSTSTVSGMDLNQIFSLMVVFMVMGMMFEMMGSMMTIEPAPARKKVSGRVKEYVA